MLQELSKDSIKPRHWESVMKVCKKEFDIVGNLEFKLQVLIEADLASVKEDIEEITEAAEKQL